MQSSAVVGELGPSLSQGVEHTEAGHPDVYSVGQEERHFRQPRTFTAVTGGPLRKENEASSKFCEFEDEQLDDLIFSWRRLTDPKLKKLAIQIIQSMAA